MACRTGSGPFDVADRFRRRGIATWLLGQAADWLALAQVDRLLDYAYLDSRNATGSDYAGYRAFLSASGFRELTRTARGWTNCYRRRQGGVKGAGHRF